MFENDLRTYGNIEKTATSCLLDYNYFKTYYKMTAIDLSKQQAHDVDPKAMQKLP